MTQEQTPPALDVGDTVILEPLRGGPRVVRRVEEVLEDWIMVFSDEMARPVRARIAGMHTKPEWELVTALVPDDAAAGKAQYDLIQAFSPDPAADQDARPPQADLFELGES